MNKDKKGPLDGIVEMYQESVEEKDKKGFADSFKKAAKVLFKGLQKEGFNVVKPQYLDGYFIFGSGTNSVVHFYIKEIPGWKFGVWWEEPKESCYNKDGELVDIDGEFFAQYEETIDKFKPSASSISKRIFSPLNHPAGEYDYWSLIRVLKFMRDEPELCFCRDYCYWDEWEYHTREEAKKKFKEYKKEKALKDKYEEKFKQKYLEWAEEVCKYLGKGARIVDKGDCWSPRYDLVCKMPNKNIHIEDPGSYNLFSDFEMNSELVDIKKKWDKLSKEVEDLCDKKDICLYASSYFNPFVDVYEEKR